MASTLADLTKGRLRNTRAELKQALTGHVREHHRFLLTELLTMIAAVDEVLAHCDAQSAAACAGAQEALELLNTSPGIGPERAEVILVEIGTDRRRLPTAHRAARARVTPEGIVNLLGDRD